MMKIRFQKIFLNIFLMCLPAFLLTGCGIHSSDIPSVPDTEETEAETPDSEETRSSAHSPSHFSHAKTQPAPANDGYVFPETAPFIDDTGKSMQRSGDCLYSYYGGRLICFDSETEETTLIYQTASTHLLNFCMYENDIYFVERTGYDSLDDKDTSLWRIGKDGSNLTLLQDDITNTGTIQYSENYSIDIYNDIVYLMHYTSEYHDGSYVAKTANLYYRLENDGSVSEIEESETLYGVLPRRFSPINDSDFPTFPYAMRNYGYIFVQDSAGTLYRMDPVSGVRESLAIRTDGAASTFAFSGDLVFLCSYYHDESSLFDLSSNSYVATDILSFDSISYLSVFSSEQGFFFCGKLWKEDDKTFTPFHILHILPDGSVNTLFSDTSQTLEEDFYDAYLRSDSCLFEDYFYYYHRDESENCLMRFPVQKTPKVQELETWSLYTASSPAAFTVEERNDTVEIGDFSSVSCSVKKLLLNGQTHSDKLINSSLREVYEDFETYVEGIIQEEQEQLEEDSEFYDDFSYTSGYDFSLSVYCDYMDDDTISFGCSYYQYYAYAAHGYYWNDYYVFDRHTGERLSFEDFAGNSAAVLNVAYPYVEQAAGWAFDSEMLLDISRFSLSEDGYTLYFAPYDIDCYAAGSFLITIPYEAFEKEL